MYVSSQSADTRMHFRKQPRPADASHHVQSRAAALGLHMSEVGTQDPGLRPDGIPAGPETSRCMDPPQNPGPWTPGLTCGTG